MDTRARVNIVLDFMSKGFWSEAIDCIAEYPCLATFVDDENFGRSLLHDAVCYDGAAKLVDRLIKLGADVSLESSTGSTPLGNAIHSGYRHGVDTDENIALLVAAGADLSKFDETGNPPLHAAIYERRSRVVSYLLSAGADPLQSNAYGDDAYAYMKWIEDTSMASLLPARRSAD